MDGKDFVGYVTPVRGFGARLCRARCPVRWTAVRRQSDSAVWASGSVAGAVVAEIILDHLFSLWQSSRDKPHTERLGCGVVIGRRLRCISRDPHARPSVNLQEASACDFCRGDALSQVWIFIVAVVGAAIAAVVYAFLDKKKEA